jgi:hypothetical protein
MRQKSRGATAVELSTGICYFFDSLAFVVEGKRNDKQIKNWREGE